MGRYIIRRLLLAVPVLLGASIIVFSMVYALPGDPIAAMGGDKVVPEAVRAQLEERFNMKDPVWLRYLKYIGGIFQGDFGSTMGDNRPVGSILAAKFPNTLKLAALAIIFETVIGITAGAIAGVKRGSWFDTAVLSSTIVVMSIPVLVLAFISQWTFGIKLGWFPISGVEQGLWSFVLPGFMIGAISLAMVARLTRTTLAENLRNDYVRTARAKGLSEPVVIVKHALRNSLIPVVTYIGADLAGLMGGTIITETIFNIPGIGNEVFQAIRAQEGPVVVGIITIMIFIYILTNLIVDVLVAMMDPRVRYE